MEHVNLQEECSIGTFGTTISQHYLIDQSSIWRLHYILVCGRLGANCQSCHGCDLPLTLTLTITLTLTLTLTADS